MFRLVDSAPESARHSGSEKAQDTAVVNFREQQRPQRRVVLGGVPESILFHDTHPYPDNQAACTGKTQVRRPAGSPRGGRIVFL
jgi:hypothetical protein